MNPKFGFLVHPRGLTDFLRKFPYLRFLPTSVLNFLTKRLPPVVVSKITGLLDKEGRAIEGYIIAITMTARQMVEDRARALMQIKRAVRFAQKKGIGLIGFGALTSSFSKGGLDLVDEVNKIGITTGRAYTVKTVTDYAKKYITECYQNKNQVRVAIVGAGGSIGSGCAKVLAEWGIQKFLFIDLEKRLTTLTAHIEHLRGNHHGIDIAISHKIKDIATSNIIIAATNSPEVLIKADDVMSGAIIINDAQPSDIAPEVLERDDVLVIEGGVISTPGIRCNFNLGLAGREETFSCLGEVLILAHNNHFENFALGELDMNLIHQIETMSKNLNIGIGRPQNDKGYISEDKIDRVKKIISSFNA